MSINIGDLLKTTREEKKMTLEQISEETKIQKRYLKALEDEKYEELPGEVHVKGFMRNYCKVVGLDPNEVVEMYKVQKGEELIIDSSKQVEVKEKKNIIIVIMVIATLIIGALLFTKIIPIFKDKPKATQERVEPQDAYKENMEELENEEISLTEVKKEIVYEKPIEEVSEIEKNSARREESVIEEKKVEKKVSKKNEQKKSVEQVKQSVEMKAEVPLKEMKKESKPVPVNEEYVKHLKIIVEGQSWMELKKNNVIVFQGILKDERVLYRGFETDEFELKIGNAGAVRLMFNEEDLGIQGKLKDVVKKKF